MLSITATASRRKRPLIFIPGWGFDGRVLRLRGELPYPPPADLSASGGRSALDNLPAPGGLPVPGGLSAPDGLIDPLTLSTDLVAWLDQQNIERCELLGWSMGGLCALEFTRLYPQRVTALHLLAVRDAWPAAEIAEIGRDLTKQPEGFLRSFYRKSLLGYREAYRRFQQELEADYLVQALAAQAVLHRGLDFLAAPRPSNLALTNSCRVYCRHGRRDLIAPPTERLLLPGADYQLLEHGGHALFLDYLPPDGL